MGRRTREQVQRLVGVWTAGIAALLLAVAAFLLVRGGGRPGFEEEDLPVCVNGDGRVEFYRPEAVSASALYRVDVACGTERVTRISPEPSFGFSDVPPGEKLRLRLGGLCGGLIPFPRRFAFEQNPPLFRHPA